MLAKQPLQIRTCQLPEWRLETGIVVAGLRIMSWLLQNKGAY